MDDTLIRMLKLGSEGYYCSQIMVILALEARGESNPTLVRAATGLAMGCGGLQGTCGVLTGAACIMGMFAGRGPDEREEDPKLPLMLQELNDWFAQRVKPEYGDITCQAIVGEDGPQGARPRCGSILADTYAQTVRILAENGFDAA